MPAGTTLPDPIGQLFDWIEDQGLVTERNGERIGTLFSPERMRATMTETVREGGTDIEFAARGTHYLPALYGSRDERVLERFSVFAKTGADGSMGAFWRDDDGRVRIVHFGSGSGSTLMCVLADDPVDFLRLLAIGYDEICWDEHFSERPEALEPRVLPNEPYRAWVTSTFGVTIPATALEIIRHPNSMDDDDPQDDFARWVRKATR